MSPAAVSRPAPRVLLLCAVLMLAAGCGENVHDDELDDLVLANGTLTPEFDPHVFEYTAEVGNDVASTTVSPTTHSSDATVTVNGEPVPSGGVSAPIPLAVGANAVDVVVTDDDDHETYSVVITRAAPPGSSAALTSLALTAAELDQMFDPSLTEYTASAGFLAASTRVMAEPEDAGATVEPGEGFQPDDIGGYVRLPVGETSLEVEVTAEDGVQTRTYGVEVTRAGRATLDQQAYLKASNTGPDAFGASAAVFGDLLVVGAPEESSAASGVDGDENDNTLGDAGAAYVFERNGGTWVQAAYLKAASPGAPDRFGGAVAVDGDLVVVGAEGEESLATGIGGDDSDDGSFRVGAVYAFARDGMGTWAQEAYIKASNAGRGDEFGRYLDIDGNRMIVGARSEDGSDDGRTESGAAYLFSRGGSGNWSEEDYLKASNADSGDEFGRAVQVSGTTAAVGAPGEDSSATGIDGDETSNFTTSSGAVYVFEADEDDEWTQTAYVKASNTDPGDAFGSSLALDGDLLAVGAPGEDGAAAGFGGDESNDAREDAGAVYVFERRDTGNWSQVAYLKASNPGLGDGFGSSLALQGNLLVVGARRENSAAPGLDGDEADDSAPDAGAVYVFEHTGTAGWRQIAYVKAASPDAGDEFGGAVAFYGDTLVVGAELEDGADSGVGGDAGDDSLTGAGAVYVIR